MTSLSPDVKPHPFFKKMRPGDMINSQAKQIILNVFFQLSSLHPQKTYKQISQEASLLTGVSYQTIFKLKAERQKSVLFGGYENQPSSDKRVPASSELNEVLAAEDANIACDAAGGPPPVGVAKPAKAKKEKREPRPVSPRSMKKKIRPNVNQVRKKRLDRYDESILTNMRLKFHNHHNPPTIGEFYKEINADELMPNFARVTFHRLMKDMGLLDLCKRPARVLNQGKAQVGKKPTPPNQQQGQQQNPNNYGPNKPGAGGRRAPAKNIAKQQQVAPPPQPQPPPPPPPPVQYQHQNRLQVPPPQLGVMPDYRIPRPYM